MQQDNSLPDYSIKALGAIATQTDIKIFTGWEAWQNGIEIQDISQSSDKIWIVSTYNRETKIVVKDENIELKPRYETSANQIANYTLNIPPDETLTITAGANIQFAYGFILEVDGTLNIQGTADNHVTLSPNNPTDYWGGIIVFSNGTPTHNVNLKHCKIFNASAFCVSEPGGNVEVNNDNVVCYMDNCLLIGDLSTISIGLLQVDNPNITMNINNCTFIGSDIFLLYSNLNSLYNFKNNIFYQVTLNNDVGFSQTGSGYNDFYECIFQGLDITSYQINNNIFEDPLLNSDYRLQYGSPCIDAGTPNEFDPDGTPTDIGAYYFPQLQGAITENTTWENELKVIGDITVFQGATLTIEPGTKIYFDSGKKLTINGTLDAQGTPVNPIVFTKTSGALWGGIWFNPGSNDNSTIKHCTIEYSASFGIFLDNSSPTIEWTKIRNCDFSGIYLMGLSCSDLSSVELTNNGSFGAIVCEGACFDPYYTLIDGNGYSEEDVFGGIYNIGESYIRYSQISNNTGIGIFIDEDSWADLGQDADDEMGYNNIGNNSFYEISSFSSETIPAVWNFWGDSDGPDPDDLNGDIEYEPFFEDDPEELPWGLGKKTVFSNLKPDLQLYRKCIKLMRNGEYSSAGKEFQDMISQYPNSYFARFAVQRWVHTMIKSNRDNEILPYLNKLKKSNIPESLENHIYKMLVHTHRKKGDSRSALSLANSSMRNRNRKKFMKYQKGFILLHDLKDTVNAVIAFKSFVRDYPKDIRAMIIQSQLSSLNGRYLIKPGAFENIPNEYKLYQAYPNPFNHQTTFQFDIPKLSRVNIAIYDILGRQVLSQNDSYQPGRYSFIWNRTSSKGKLVSSGVYFIILSTEKYHASQKILFLK